MIVVTVVRTVTHKPITQNIISLALYIYRGNYYTEHRYLCNTVWHCARVSAPLFGTIGKRPDSDRDSVGTWSWSDWNPTVIWSELNCNPIKTRPRSYRHKIPLESRSDSSWITVKIQLKYTHNRNVDCDLIWIGFQS